MKKEHTKFDREKREAIDNLMADLIAQFAQKVGQLLAEEGLGFVFMAQGDSHYDNCQYQNPDGDEKHIQNMVVEATFIIAPDLESGAFQAGVRHEENPDVEVKRMRVGKTLSTVEELLAEVLGKEGTND